MFKHEDVSNEIAESMQKELVSAVLEKRAEPLDKYASALEALYKAAEIFDDLGLSKEAEYTTTLLEVVAKKKQPSKSKSRKPAKKSDPAMSGLTGEKMVQNLKEKGWVFNADDNDAHSHGKPSMLDYEKNKAFWHSYDNRPKWAEEASPDEWASHYHEENKHRAEKVFKDRNKTADHSKGCMCSMCMDVNDVRHGDDCVCHLCMDDDRYKMEVDDNAHYDAKSDASCHIEHNDANDWNFASLFDMHDFEDEIDLPKPRRKV